MRIGSLFAGVGGLDLGVEWTTGARTVWQLDRTLADVRARHWPDALQVTANIEDVDPLALPEVDALCGGFSCKGVSTAGPGTLLEHPETAATYYGLLRFARVLRPRWAIIENTPAMLTRLRGVMEEHYGALGYGLTWVRARALDVGAPHIRRRVFCVAVLGAPHGGVLDAPRGGAWVGDTWATVKASDDKSPGAYGGRQGSDGLAVQVRHWPTPTTANPNEGEDPKSHAARSAALVARGSRPLSEPLGMAARTWTTTTTRDYKTGQLPSRQGSDALPVQAAPGKRLNPDWVETLVGLPVGWTHPTGPTLAASRAPRWPRGRCPKDHDRTTPWPGYDWEPPRTLPDGPPCKGRPARIRACGNITVPQQALLAIETWLEGVP